MNNQSQVQEQSEVLRQPGSRWFAAFGTTVPAESPRYECRRVAGNGRQRHLYLSGEIGTALPIVAERSGCGVIFDGALYNRLDLQAELGDFMASAGSNDAKTVLAGYLRWGEDLFARLRGSFALLVWDTVREIFLCLRDPLGSCPMFYTKRDDGLLVSTSIDVLLAQPHVSGSLNRGALADFLLDRFPINEETYFNAINRVPRGEVLRINGAHQNSYCYWDPAPDGTVDWIKEDE